MKTILKFALKRRNSVKNKKILKKLPNYNKKRLKYGKIIMVIKDVYRKTINFTN